MDTNSSVEKPEIPWPDGGEYGTVPVDGGEVFYRLYGRGTKGIPLVFLHGGPGGTSACFHRQIVFAEDHPVLLYNQLGSSRSSFDSSLTDVSEIKKLLNIPHYVEELDTLIHYFNFQQFIIIGSSWGTMLAVEYAAAKQPSGLKAMILNGPFLSVDIWIRDAERLIKTLPDGEKMWHTIQECEALQEYGAEYQEINKIYSCNFNCRDESSRMNTPTEPAANNLEQLSVYQYMWGPSEFSCTGTLNGHDSTPLLKSIHVPILYTCGQYDSGSPEAAFYYHSLSNSSEVCILPGCAHSSMRERYQEFNAIAAGFIRRIEK